MQPELIADYQCQTGEGPLWHAAEKRLYWVDIAKPGRMFCYDPATGKHEQVYEGETVGGFTVQADGALLLFMDRGAVKTWRKGQLTTVIEDIPDERASRFNDVFADPMGRVYCGTMPTKERLGRLYRLDTDGSIHLVLEGITCSNGMGLTPDRKQMYYTDSMVRKIYLFDYDQATGALTNQRLFLKTPDDEGVPDGMTVDAEGYVWSARWDGNALFRYAPDGREVLRVPFPAKKVSCPTFGGEDCMDLYVTCAGGADKAAEGPGAGALFRVRLGIRGVPECLSRVRL
jgi:D-xylonolactonase